MLIPPGEYWVSVYMTWSGATGTVTHAIIRAVNYAAAASLFIAGNSSLVHEIKLSTGGSNPAPDPGNVTGWSLAGGVASNSGLAIGFAPS
jgi:hypothetical protein